MNMRIVVAILNKQVKDTLKNKEVLVQFIMFPAIALVMVNAIKLPGMPENFFVTLFATMYIGMAPLTAMSAILAEEKEKNTLRVLLMSNVKASEYLLGTGFYVWAVCMLGALAFGLMGHYQGGELALFMTVMGVGILASLIIGAAIGIWSRSQMGATSLAVPVMMVFAFLPMIAMFNENVSKIARFTYSQQVNNMMAGIGGEGIGAENIIITGVNMLAALALFGAAYKKCGID